MTAQAMLELADRIKAALSGETVLTGEPCKHGWDRAVCVIKECGNPYALEPLLEQAEAAKIEAPRCFTRSIKSKR